MSAVKNFRSAFNGFNREDVVHYIEYVNNKHNFAINQLNGELQALKDELAVLRAKPEQDPALLAQLEESQNANAALTEELASLRAQIDSLTQEISDKEPEQVIAPAEQEDLRQELESAKQELADTKLELEKARQSVATAQLNYELEAYRRAERVERMAGERVSRMYDQINSILAEAALQADESAAQIGQAADKVAAQMAELQAAINQSRNAMKETATAMYAVRPLKAD